MSYEENESSKVKTDNPLTPKQDNSWIEALPERTVNPLPRVTERAAPVDEMLLGVDYERDPITGEVFTVQVPLPREPDSMERHVLATRETCNIIHYEDRQCPICDGGLAVCVKCGKFESALDEPCQPRDAQIHAVEPPQYVEQYGNCPRCGNRIYNAQTEWRHVINRSPTCPADEAKDSGRIAQVTAGSPSFRVCEGDVNCAQEAEYEARIKGHAGNGRDGRVPLCVRCQANARANGILIDTYHIDNPPPQSKTVSPDSPASESQFDVTVNLDDVIDNPDTLSQAMDAAAQKFAERTWNDPEWTEPRYTHRKDIIKAFAVGTLEADAWFVSYGVPPNFEIVLNSLSGAIASKWPGDDEMLQVLLLDVQAFYREFIDATPLCREWNDWPGSGFVTRYDGTAKERTFIDLDALVGNACRSIRDDRRAFDKFNAEFDARHGAIKETA